MSRLPLFAVSAALHFYVGARIVPALPPGWDLAFVALLVASAVLVPVAMLARGLAPPKLADRLTWAGMVAMGLFSSLLVFTFVRDLALVLAWTATLWFELPLAGWERASGIAVVLAALAATAFGLVNARRTARVKRVRVSVPGLPAAFEGFRIVQISDIHVGPTIKRGYLQAIVDTVNALQPDAVAVTGDLVDGSVAELAEHVAPLGQLRARAGSYFVTGNHEYYSGVHGWVAELRRLGLRVLHNEHVVLHQGDGRMVLAGVPDYGGGHFDPAHASDPGLAAAGAPLDTVKVLLAHQPRSAPAAAAAGFDLQISGHTHGGQFLPWGWFVPLQQPFTAGLHRHGRLQVYVSRGTGYWGPPKRLGAPSEITEIRLVAA